MGMTLNRQGGRVRAPLGGGRAKIENSSRRHPRKFGQKRFLAMRRSWRGNEVACFWATSLEKIFGGVIAIISFRPGVGCSSLPCRGVLSFRSGAREGPGDETARFDLAACRRHGFRLDVERQLTDGRRPMQFILIVVAIAAAILFDVRKPARESLPAVRVVPA